MSSTRTAALAARRIILQEPGKGVLAGANEYRIGVPCGLLRQRRDVKAAEQDVGPSGAIVVCDLVGAVGIGDVDLDDDQVRLIAQVELLNMLVS